MLPVNEGYRSSKQYHRQKNEVMFYDDGKTMHNPINTIHR